MGFQRSDSPTTITPISVTGVSLAYKKSLPIVDTLVSSEDEESREASVTSDEEVCTDTTYLKEELLALLAESHGSTKDEKITDIITKLSERNPCKKGSSLLDLLPGDCRTVTIPHYPGRIKAEDESVFQYTLGRLSFNIFQPNELVCTVTAIRNQVQLLHNVPDSLDVKQGDNTAVFSYNIICDLIIHTPDGDLEANLINEGFCRQSEDRDNRMKVTFKGGTLVPSSSTCDNDRLLALWKKTFANAYEIANKRRSLLGWVYLFCLKLFLGLVLPTDYQNFGSTRHENAFNFEINRAPKGFIDVLYLDDHMRITKGNRGTITVLLNE